MVSSMLTGRVRCAAAFTAHTIGATLSSSLESWEMRVEARAEKKEISAAQMEAAVAFSNMIQVVLAWRESRTSRTCLALVAARVASIGCSTVAGCSRGCLVGAQTVLRMPPTPDLAPSQRVAHGCAVAGCGWSDVVTTIFTSLGQDPTGIVIAKNIGITVTLSLLVSYYLGATTVEYAIGDAKNPVGERHAMQPLT